MNEKEIKFYLALIYIGVCVSALLLVIDFKLKSDTVKLLGDKSGARPDYQASNWGRVRFDNNYIRTIPDSRFAPRMEEASPNHSSTENTADSSELGDGEGNTELPPNDFEMGT